MFSWSTNRTRNDGGGGNTFTYPGNRVQQSVAAPVIQGTIRGPQQQQQQQNYYTRDQHLNSYLQDATLSRSTRKAPNESNSYDTVFQTVKGETLKLRVQLPPGQPNDGMVDPPRMLLAGVRASHDWLDSSGNRIIGYKPITSRKEWITKNALLGKVVHDVVKHLQLHPPTIHAFTDPRLYSMQTIAIQQTIQLLQQQTTTNNNSSSPTKRATGGSITQSPPPPPAYDAAFLPQQRRGNSRSPPPMSSQQHLPPPPSFEDHMDINKAIENMSIPNNVEMPQIPSKFDDLGDDREFLDDLLKSDVELISYCNSLPIMKEIQTLSLSVIEENARIAKEHLSKEQELHDMHEKAFELQKELTTKVNEFNKLKQQQDTINAPPDTRMVMKKLHEAKKSSFDTSEELAEDWVDNGTTSVDEFCNSFLKQRKLHHQRAAKLELLQTQSQIQQ